jgi:hypothetical protein
MKKNPVLLAFSHVLLGFALTPVRSNQLFSTPGFFENSRYVPRRGCSTIRQELQTRPKLWKTTNDRLSSSRMLGIWQGNSLKVLALFSGTAQRQ